MSVDAMSVNIANAMCMSHTSAFEGNMYIDDASMVCAKVFEYQQVQTLQETDILSDDATSVCTSSKSVISYAGRGNLDMSDAEFGVFIGDEQSCKEKATHDITGEGGEEDVCVVETAGHKSDDG